ncbi:peptidase M16 [Segetibacter aerophilus]|uniref:Peptidase M16 n=2 Tax=Segetibacter aerophilus TaxID=670293 RepID=A0A512BJX7_9BACT|nr:peptidase M16 [Segetibacter aerophilus]
MQMPAAVFSQSKLAAKEEDSQKFDRSRYQVKYKKFVLDNGLTLLVNEDHNVPVVGVNFWYHVGSRNEQRGKTGFAHLFEHFFFNGSENYPHGFREAMDDLGANNRNGTTNTDRTNFFEDVPVSALERTLYLEADRMGFLTGRITKEMLERERGVVQNEKRQGENQPYGRVFPEISAKMYPYSHPYSWSTIGSMDDLNAASLQDVKDWYKTYYGPNNAVLALAGDITPENALQLVTKYFGGIAPGPALTRTEKWIPTLDRNIRAEMQDRVPQTRIYRVYHIPEWKNRDLQYLSLVGDVLSGSKSARLDRRLINEKQLATSVGAGIDAGELASTFIMEVTLKAGVDPLVAEKELDAVVNELILKGPTEEELKRVKSISLANFQRSLERLGGMGGRSDILAESMTYGGSPEAYLDQMEVMAKATPAEVKAAAKTWLVANHYTMTVKPYPSIAAAAVKLDRTVLPPLAQAPEIKFPQVQRNKLKNGLNVVLLERHSAPIVNVTIAADAGYASDPTGKAGTASLALDLMDEGTKTLDAFQISNQLDLLGATLNSFSQLDLSFVRLGATSENLRPSLKILSDVLLNPSFPADQFALKKQQRLSQIGQEKSQASGAALRILPQLLFGANHNYSNPLSGSGYETSVQTIQRADLIDWHSKWFKPGSSTVIVTGDVTMDKLMPALEEAFAGWTAGNAPAKNIAVVDKTKGGKVYLIDKPDAPQSTIIAAHISEASGQPEDVAIQTVMQNFGGMATSRLNRNLRLDKHWSYGTNGALMTARGQRPFLVIAPVQTDKTKESMVEVIKEIKGVAGERELAGEEYESIMRNMTLRLPARFSTLSALESAATEMINYKLPDDYWSRYAERVRGLTAPALNEAAKKYVHPSDIIWIVVGDRKKIESGIKSLNYGEVILLNTDGKVISE